MSENDFSYSEKNASPKEWERDNKQKQRTKCSDRVEMDEDTGTDSEGETFRELVRKHSDLSKQRDDITKVGVRRAVINQRRPMLERKSHSDLTSYCNTKIKILVEGKELSSTDIQGKYSSKGLSSSLQETSINSDHIAELRQEKNDHDKNKLRSFVGWFGKSHAKAYDLNYAAKNSEETTEKRSPLLRRSRSFSGRIRDKFKMSFTSTNEKQPEAFQTPKSNFLQPPNMFYRNNVDRNKLNGVGVTQFGLQRRHSDQTDSMLRRPLGGRRVNACPAYYSLDRGLREISGKKPLTRKRSNSFEKQDDFPFWSQISDTNRSNSCSARISVTEQLDTHRGNDGMLETNLCSTEL